jgi:hypothetical protein
MATTTDLTVRIEAALREIAAEVDFLPELAKAWNDRPDDSKVSFYLEWDELMDRLDRLNGAYRGDHMSLDQQTRYRALLGKLMRARPLLEQLDLQAPSLAPES